MKLFILLFLLPLSILKANSSSNINTMILDIQNSPANERYQKMNDFKKMLRNMNAQNRMQALENLQYIQPTKTVRTPLDATAIQQTINQQITTTNLNTQQAIQNHVTTPTLKHTPPTITTGKPSGPSIPKGPRH